MLRIRVKMGPPRNNEWTCCFRLHVRTATVMIGVWHLFLNVLALGLLALIVRDPAMMHELENGYDDPIDEDAPALPTPLSKIDPPYAYRDHSLNYHNVDMGGLVCICMIAITLMMIYGAVKGKSAHLLPFFCLQLFDFSITSLTAVGYLCYLRSVHSLIADNHRLPWREELLKLSPQCLSVIVFVAFFSVVLLKAYAIGIVWRCYKYLTMRQHNIRSMLPYIIPEVSTLRQERDYSSLLPDYDEAIAQSMKTPPPPSYQAAMANAQTLPLQTITNVNAGVNIDNINSRGTVADVVITDSEGGASGGIIIPRETDAIRTAAVAATTAATAAVAPVRSTTMTPMNLNITNEFEIVDIDEPSTSSADMTPPPPYTKVTSATTTPDSINPANIITNNFNINKTENIKMV